MYVADIGECAGTGKSELAYAAMRHANEDEEDPREQSKRRTRPTASTSSVTSSNFCHVTDVSQKGNHCFKGEQVLR